MNFKHLLFFLLFPTFIWSQENDPIPKDIKESDSLSNLIELEKITIFPPPKFESEESRKAYYTLRWMVYRVYPFARSASKMLELINNRMENLSSKSDKKRYLKILQNYIKNRFSKELKKYTIWEGQILIKLIHRQTGITCYDLVKVLRSKFQALLFNTSAKFFNMSLKKEYHPELIYKDFLIEQILVRGFSNGDLDAQDYKKGTDFDELETYWQKINGRPTIKFVDIKSND